MATKNLSTQTADIESRLLAKLTPLIKEAIDEGQRLGLADAVRRLAEGTAELTALNYTAAPRRDKAPKGTVQCPVPNCNRPGIRPQSNFCKHHVETLDAKKREVLRAKQLETRKKEKEKARELEIAARRGVETAAEAVAA